MNRREYIKTITLGSILPLALGCKTSTVLGGYFKGPQKVNFKSNWHQWDDMKWAGPEYWGNTLQDWNIQQGKLVCDVTAKNRNIHLLTLQNPNGNASLNMEVTTEFLNPEISKANKGCVGFRIGAKGPFKDYRSAAVFGKGFDIGLTPNKQLQIGQEIYDIHKNVNKTVTIFVNTQKANDLNQYLTVRVKDVETNDVVIEKKDILISNESLKGNIALLSDIQIKGKKQINKPSVSFSNWQIFSDDLYQNENNIYGPVCFAQYTLHKKKLKLTGQFAPIENIKNHQVELSFKHNGVWQVNTTTQLKHEGRAINFEIDNWKYTKNIPYKISVKIPLKNQVVSYEYEGTISKEPIDEEKVKAAVFSCNFHFGFPDADIHESVSKLNPDVILFLGDQFYEGTGGFGAQYNGDYDKMCLDYLRKWMMFGWSYREIFRHVPCAIIPDDHDVYHGNVWGEEGKLADNSKGYGASSQDSGGYKMPAKWVNMVQYTQTSHLPDPYDATPVKNNIGVYYTHWNYAGISFAILEDRKFKSAPAHILPKEAKVHNGWITADDFDIKQYKNLDAELLGNRQEQFLENWVQDWSENAQLKVVLSQTNFATVATLPKDAKTDSVVPKLHIPEKGEYVKGDKPTADMDSNGWPSNKRDVAVDIIRKGFAFHIAGDQHLGSFIQYGLDEHGDSGYAFAGPALNNIWPRRFWPDVDATNHTYENPAYTGNHIDGFGNKMTVKAVGNPYNKHLEPQILHNRAVGFGVVTFNKKDRTIKTDCYQRFADVTKAEAQYPGWPQTVAQQDNYARKAKGYLPLIVVNGTEKPVIRIYNEQTKELVYALRSNQQRFKAKVFDVDATYTVEVECTENNILKTKKGNKIRRNWGVFGI